MIAGPPGAGKSTLALAFAVAARVPTLYLSADTHAHTMSLRLLAMLTGWQQQQIEPLMDNREWASGLLQNTDHIMWAFDSAPSFKDIEAEIEAFNERMGRYPELIVIDNAVDVSLDGMDEYGGLRFLFRELKWWARETGAAVIVCHHTSEAANSDPCPPRSALHGKVAQTPALILTVGGTVPLLAVCPVKNRYGPADPTGHEAIWLSYDPASMQIKDLEQQ